MKISILLPYKENFTPNYAGAVSLFLNDTIKLSKFKKNIQVYGNTSFKKSTLIEVHNRPDYINSIHEINTNIVLYFHNNPLDMRSSKTVKERIDVYNKTKKIIFNSNWTLKKFTKGLNEKYNTDKLEVINQSTSKKIINFKNKKKIILFVGRLNASKGYDLFGKAIISLLNKYPDWKAIVIGDEPRENHIFEHKNLKILGFQKYNVVTKWFVKSDISVVCSRWDEPFGRTALEASSAGCAVIITDKGGLSEASPKALKIKSLTVKNIENSIEKLIKNVSLKKSLQKKIYKHFYLTNNYISKKIDIYRDKLI